MAKRKARSFTTFAAIVVIGFLAAFFMYMWRYDYKVQRPQEFSGFSRSLRGILRIDQKGEYGFGGPVAVLTLANASPTRVRLLDTRLIFPLYDIKLAFKNDAGQWTDMPQIPDAVRRYSPPPGKTDIFDKDNDAIAELVTGSGYTRAIPLSYLYNLNDHSQFKLTLTYQPEKVAEVMGETFNFLDVTRDTVGLTELFDYPEKKVPKEPAPAKEAEAPQEPVKPAQEVKKGSVGESKVDD